MTSFPVPLLPLALVFAFLVPEVRAEPPVQSNQLSMYVANQQAKKCTPLHSEVIATTPGGKRLSLLPPDDAVDNVMKATNVTEALANKYFDGKEQSLELCFYYTQMLMTAPPGSIHPISGKKYIAFGNVGDKMFYIDLHTATSSTQKWISALKPEKFEFERMYDEIVTSHCPTKMDQDNGYIFEMSRGNKFYNLAHQADLTGALHDKAMKASAGGILKFCGYQSKIDLGRGMLYRGVIVVDAPEPGYDMKTFLVTISEPMLGQGNPRVERITSMKGNDLLV